MKIKLKIQAFKYFDSTVENNDDTADMKIYEIISKMRKI